MEEPVFGAVKLPAVRSALLLSILWSASSAWGDELAPRYLADQFEFEVLPKLQLKGKTARTVIDELGQVGFRCALVPEQRNLVDPSKPLQPFVRCDRLLTTKEGKVYGAVMANSFLNGWKGDGTPLAARFERLATAEVDTTLVVGLPYGDDRDSKDSRKQSSVLDRTLVIAMPNQPMSEVVKYAMTHEILCRAVTTEDHRATLECSAFRPSARCGHALISIALSEGTESSQPVTIWSTDRVVAGKQGPWICLNGSK